MRLYKHLPNLLTLTNLMFGLLAVQFAWTGSLEHAAWCIFIAAIFDFTDGFAARLLKAYSELGKQLDSLADVVSFGVAPASILYVLLQQQSQSVQSWAGDGLLYKLLMYLPFLIALFSALRLAKFNIDERQTSSFIGLPTPANAMLIASIPLSTTIGNFDLHQWITNAYVLLGISVGFSYLLVSPLPLFALKFKHFRFKGNEIRFLFLGTALVLVITLFLNAIPFIILSYVLISILNVIFAKDKGDTNLT